VLFFSVGAGAAFQVVTEVGRYVARKVDGALTSPWVLGGFFAGIVVMYVTEVLVG
jgi:zinc transporter, ZIP family